MASLQAVFRRGMAVLALASALPYCIPASAQGTGRWASIEFWGITPAVLRTPAFTPLRGLAVGTPLSAGLAAPELLSVTVQGTLVRVTFFTTDLEEGVPFPSASRRFDLPGLPPGTYDLIVVNDLAASDSVSAGARRSLVVEGAPPALLISSMGFMVTDETLGEPSVPIPKNGIRPKYYLALGADETARLLALNTIPLLPGVAPQPGWWARSDAPFRAWPATGDAPAATVPVCRFFHPTFVTHFYSTKPTECALVRGAGGWVDEGIAFRVLPPTATGTCLPGTEAVYRLFSPTLINHRYTPRTSTYEAMQLKGWTPEGVAFCAPTQ